MSSFVGWLREIEPLVGGFEGKLVLDVGCDWKADLIKTLSNEFGAAEAIGINLICNDVQFSKTARTGQADVRNLPFESNYFDIVLSSCLFEHIRGLNKALNEIHRVPKKGETSLHAFWSDLVNPIWSPSMDLTQWHGIYLS